MLAVQFYDVVKSVHVMSVVLAFGVTFGYPVMVPVLARANPRSLPAFHLAQERVGKFLITPFAILALITGIYMASDRDLFGNLWIEGPLLILIVLLGMGGAFFAPNERKARAAAERDIAAAGDGDVRFSPEYEALARRIAMGGTFAGILILTAIFLMVAKPG